MPTVVSVRASRVGPACARWKRRTLASACQSRARVDSRREDPEHLRPTQL